MKKNQQEVRSKVARLLSVENITVRHGNFRTAFFSPETRFLGLPIWKDVSEHVYDMLVGHEVGHALWTPPGKMEGKTGNQAMYLNVCEDVRIERLIQKKYPGLVHSFQEAYQELVDNNFFEINGKNLDALSFPDRVNVKAKAGDYININFHNSEEERIWDMIQKAETFDQVERAAKEMELYMKDVEEKQKQQQEKDKEKNDQKKDESEDPSQRGQNDSSEDRDSDDSEQDGDSDKSDDSEDSGDSSSKKKSSKSKSQKSENSSKDDAESDESDEDGDEKQGDSGKADSKAKEPKSESKSQKYGAPLKSPSSKILDKGLSQKLESTTMKAFEEAVKDLVDTSAKAKITIRAQTPLDSVVDKHIIPHDKVMAGRYMDVFQKTVTGYEAHLTKTKKFIAILQKEFEQRKAASQYIRATQARTGQINVNRLHAYKVADDIFKSVTVLANAKNHGLVMLVDYSGSMQGVIKDVYIQVINISMFCKACNIPFVVYGFTDGNALIRYNEQKMPKNTTIDGHVDFKSLRLIEVMSSKMTPANYKKGLFELWMMSKGGPISSHESLGGTPLNEAIVACHSLVSRFKKEHKVEKMTFLVVSDGAGGSLNVNVDPNFSKMTSGSFIPTGMEIRLGGRKFETSLSYRECTTGLIDNMRKSMDVRTICFFITGGDINSMKSEARDAISNGLNKNLNVEKLAQKVTVEKMIHVPGGHHYDDYFVIGGEGLQVNTSEFSESATSKMTVDDVSKAFESYAMEKRFSRAFAIKFAEAIR